MGTYQLKFPRMAFKFGQEPIPQPDRQYPEDYTEEEIKREKEWASKRYAEKFEPMPEPDKIYPQDYTEDEIRDDKERAAKRYSQSEPFPLPPDEEEEAIRKARETLANAPSSEVGPETVGERQ